MFEVYYPGNCFGNIDVNAKECKKCKIKSFCSPNHKQEQIDTGIDYFREMICERFICDINQEENGTIVKCFEKNSEIPNVIVNFSDNGQVTVSKGENKTTIQHIVSKEKAEDLFKRLIDAP